MTTQFSGISFVNAKGMLVKKVFFKISLSPYRNPKCALTGDENSIYKTIIIDIVLLSAADTQCMYVGYATDWHKVCHSVFYRHYDYAWHNK